MRATVTKTGITFTHILNESLHEQVSQTAKAAGAAVVFSNYSTKARVTGSPAVLAKFIELWNRR